MTDAERRELRTLQKQRRDDDGYVKITVVLMLDTGRSLAIAAQDLGLVEAREAQLLCLPPCSLDTNPIDLTFSKLRAWLRTTQARTCDALEAALRKASGWITQQDAGNWLDYGSYHVH